MDLIIIGILGFLFIAFIIYVNFWWHYIGKKQEQERRSKMTQEERDEEDFMNWADRNIW